MVKGERGLPDDLDAVEVAFDDERLVADAGLQPRTAATSPLSSP